MWTYLPHFWIECCFACSIIMIILKKNCTWTGVFITSNGAGFQDLLGSSSIGSFAAQVQQNQMVVRAACTGTNNRKEHEDAISCRTWSYKSSITFTSPPSLGTPLNSTITWGLAVGWLCSSALMNPVQSPLQLRTVALPSSTHSSAADLLPVVFLEVILLSSHRHNFR